MSLCKTLLPKLIFSALITGGFTTANGQDLANTQKLPQGANIYQPVYNPVENAVYVSSAKGGNQEGVIYKLDGKTLAVTDSITVPGAAPQGLGINVKTQTLYSTNSRKSVVVATDIKTGNQTYISSTVPGANAREVRVDEDRNLVYITSVSNGGIWVIDGNTNKFQRYIYNLGRVLTGTAVDVKNNKLYATAMSDNQIVVVDAATGIVEKKFDAHGERPTNVFYDQTNARLLVANQGTANITVLDLEDGKLIKEIPTGKGALGVDYDAKNNLIYVANRGARTVSVIDGTKLEVIKNIAMDALPNTVAINRNTGEVYVTNKVAVRERDENGKEFVREAKNGDSVSLIKL